MKKFILLLTSSLLVYLSPSYACTGMEVKTQNGEIINGRTLEFALPMPLRTIFVPRNYKVVSKLDNTHNGLAYTTKYAMLGAGTYNDPNIADGMNEKGLTIGDFYFPNYAVYTDYKTTPNQSNLLSPTQFSNWVLSQFATVEEVKSALNQIKIANVIPTGWPISPPFHYIVYDKTGKSIVIEPVKDGLRAYDNPTGVLTNSPDFPWQMTNLHNYVNLTNINPKSVLMGKHQLQAFGQGAGLFGIPGDFTPPSRFVRAVVFSTTAVPAPDLQQGITQMFHLLHQFDIPAGSSVSNDNGKLLYDYTIATVVRDPQNLVMYFVTYDQPFKLQKMQLSNYDLNGKQLIIGNQIQGTSPYFTKM